MVGKALCRNWDAYWGELMQLLHGRHKKSSWFMVGTSILTLEIRYHFRQELVLDGKVKLDYFAVEESYVDLFMKSLEPVWINNSSKQSSTSEMLWKFRELNDLHSSSVWSKFPLVLSCDSSNLHVFSTFIVYRVLYALYSWRFGINMCWLSFMTNMCINYPTN